MRYVLILGRKQTLGSALTAVSLVKSTHCAAEVHRNRSDLSMSFASSGNDNMYLAAYVCRQTGLLLERLGTRSLTDSKSWLPLK